MRLLPRAWRALTGRRLRCKVGDIACIYRLRDGVSPYEAEVTRRVMGIPVRLVSVSADGMWHFDRSLSVQVTWLLHAEVTGAHDDILMPFRGEVQPEAAASHADMPAEVPVEA